MVNIEEEMGVVVAVHVFELDLVLHGASLQVNHRQISANGMHNSRLVGGTLPPVWLLDAAR